MTIFDHRVYTIKPNRLGRFLETYERLALPIQRKYLGEAYGFSSCISARSAGLCIFGGTRASPTASSAATPWRRTHHRRSWRPALGRRG
jgi:hypothetical protein